MRIQNAEAHERGKQFINIHLSCFTKTPRPPCLLIWYGFINYYRYSAVSNCTSSNDLELKENKLVLIENCTKFYLGQTGIVKFPSYIFKLHPEHLSQR